MSTDQKVATRRQASTGSSLSIVHVVVTDAFAGVERYVCQVASRLAEDGHRITVVGGDPDRMRAESDPRVETVPASGLLAAARVLAGQRRADLVHVHMTAAEGAAWLARPGHRAPIVATRHFANERGSTPLARSLAKVVNRSVACDIAISEFVAGRVAGPTVVIPNGVAVRPQAGLDSATVVMLQRLDTEKAPEVGIRAWAASGLGTRGWQLVVAGRGALRPSLEDLVANLGVGSSVRFAGQVSDTDSLLAGAAALLAPAPAEPFGLSVVEAMAHGLPVVAAAGGAHLETVGSEGLLFPPGDVDAAGARLAALEGGVERRREVGGRMRERQQALFTVAGHVRRLEEVYREVASGSVPGT